MIKSIYSHLGESESQKPNKASENQIISFEKLKNHENNGNRDIDFHLLNTLEFSIIQIFNMMLLESV